MGKAVKSAPRALDILSAMKAESSGLAAQIAEWMARKYKIDEAIALYEGKAAKPPKGKARIAQAKMPNGSIFYGMDLPQAVTKQLSMMSGAQLPHEIWEKMADQYPSLSKDPAHGVRYALQRRSKREGDVMLVGEGKWAMTNWYSEEERRKIEASLGSMAGRDRANHIEKTKAAIRSMQARGVHFGRKRKMTSEKVAKMRQLIEGGMSVADVCKELAISTGTFAKYKKDMPGLKVPKKRRQSAKTRGVEEPDLLSHNSRRGAIN